MLRIGDYVNHNSEIGIVRSKRTYSRQVFSRIRFDNGKLVWIMDARLKCIRKSSVRVCGYLHDKYALIPRVDPKYKPEQIDDEFRLFFQGVCDVCNNSTYRGAFFNECHKFCCRQCAHALKKN